MKDGHTHRYLDKVLIEMFSITVWALQFINTSKCGLWRPSPFNPLPINNAAMRHDLCELSISLWEFIWWVNTRRYSSVHVVCFF